MGIKDWIGPAASVAFGTDVGNWADAAFNQPSNKFKKQYKYQKEFAQNAIQWRVADAVAAGLHPLAALGMPVASYSPVSVGESGGSIQAAMSDMGQNITRGMTAMSAPADKLSSQYQALQLENASLQNDKLRSEIAIMNQAGTPPGLPVGIVDGVNTDPRMNERLQPRHGELADWLTAPQTVLEVLRQPGNMADPRLAKQAMDWLWSVLERGGSFNRRSPLSRGGGGGY